MPRTAWVMMPSPKLASKNLLIAPSATPSKRANAITSAGLITRLNEFTSESRNAAPEPTIISVVAVPRAASS